MTARIAEPAAMLFAVATTLGATAPAAHPAIVIVVAGESAGFVALAATATSLRPATLRTPASSAIVVVAHEAPGLVALAIAAVHGAAAASATIVVTPALARRFGMAL